VNRDGKSRARGRDATRNPVRAEPSRANHSAPIRASESVLRLLGTSRGPSPRKIFANGKERKRSRLFLAAMLVAASRCAINNKTKIF
jgi:hypothetical protein